MLVGGRPSSCWKQVNSDKNPTTITDLGEPAQGQLQSDYDHIGPVPSLFTSSGKKWTDILWTPICLKVINTVNNRLALKGMQKRMYVKFRTLF